MDGSNNSHNNGLNNKHIIILVFVLCGLMGSLVMDSDHLQPFLEKPSLLRSNFSIEEFWTVSKGEERNLHTTALMFMSTALIATIIMRKG
jgi:hypothetical protein